MQDPIYAQITEKERPSLFAASGLILLAALGLWVSSLLELWLLPGGVSPLTDAVYYLPFMALPLALYMRKRPGLSDSMRLNPLPVFPTLSVALLALLSVYVASALATVWEYGLNALGLRAVNAVSLPQTRNELIIAVVAMAAIPAVFEELLFRGLVLAAWESRGTGFAIGVAAGLFALLHGNLYGLPAYLLVGALAGFVTFALNSVYAGIVYHTVYNAACLVIPYMAAREGGEAEIAMSGSLLFALALEVITFATLTAMLLATLRLRAHRAGIEPIPRIRRPLAHREALMLWIAVAAMLISLIAVTALSEGAAVGGAL